MLIVWTGLLLWRADVLIQPPYEDQAVGLWTEADFLARSDFDYLALRYEQRHYTDLSDPRHPGVRSYMISLLPTLLATLMRTCDDPRTSFLLAHVGTLGLAACLVVWMVGTIRQQTGTAIAVLAAACVVTTPLFSTQMELVGMDLPLAAATTVCLACVARRRWGWAVVASAAAFLCKSTGVVVTTALAAILLLPQRSAAPANCGGNPLGSVRLGVLYLLVIELLLIVWGDPLPQLRGTALPWPKSFRLPDAAWLCPDVVAALLLMLAFTAPWAWRGMTSLLRGGAHDVHAATQAGQVPPAAAQVVCLAWLILLGLLFGMLRWIALPRYWTTVVPLIWINLGIWCGLRPKRRWWAGVVMASLVAVNLSNQRGRWMSELTPLMDADEQRNAFVTARSCVYQERSRAYVKEQETWRRLFRELERNYASHPVCLPHPYWYYAKNPRLGYVSRPLCAFLAADCDTSWDQLVRLAGEHAAADRAPILVWAGLSRVTLPPPGPYDQIIFRDDRWSPVVAYLPAVWSDATALATVEANAATVSLGPAGELVSARQRRVQQWLVDATGKGGWRPQRAFFRAPYLAKTGQWKRAEQELARSFPEDPAWQPLLEHARLHVQRSRAEAAFWPRLGNEFPELAVSLTRLLQNEAATRPTADRDQATHGSALLAALDRLAEGRYDLALADFHQVQEQAANERQKVVARLAGRVLAACRGEHASEARSEPEVAPGMADVDQRFWDAMMLASLRDREIGDVERRLSDVLQAAPGCPTAHREFAAWLGRGQRYAEALDHVERVLRIDSQDAAASLHRQAISRRSATRQSPPSPSAP